MQIHSRFSAGFPQGTPVSLAKFGARNTLVPLNDFPVLIDVKAEFQPGTEYAAHILLKDGEESLASWREVLQNGATRVRESKEYEKTKIASEAAIRSLFETGKKEVVELKEAIKKLQEIVNS